MHSTAPRTRSVLSALLLATALVLACSKREATPIPRADVGVDARTDAARDARADAADVALTEGYLPPFAPPGMYAPRRRERGPRGAFDEVTADGQAVSPPVCAEGASEDGALCDRLAATHIYRQLLDAALAEVLVTPTRTEAAPPSPPWSRAITPAMRDVGAVYAITRAEWNAVARNGLAVLDRVTFPTYAEAYRDVYRSEAPLLVTADSIFHAVWRDLEAIVEDTESRAVDTVVSALTRTRAAIPAMRASLPEHAARDLDVYLSVALSLDQSEGIDAPLDASLANEVTALVTMLREGGAPRTVSLWGRDRTIEPSRYVPHGAHTRTDGRASWYRVARWLATAEFNLVSRDGRSSAPGPTPVTDDTPREALDAFALVAVMERAHTLDTFRTLAALHGDLAGPRVNPSLDELREIRTAAAVTSLRAPDAFARLKAAVGNQFERTLVTHPTAPGVRALPVIATVFGATEEHPVDPGARLASPAIAGRDAPSGADLARALGYAPAARFTAADEARYPTLRAAHESVERDLAALADTGSLEGLQVDALRRHAQPVTGALPAFMRSPAWSDLRMNSLVVAWAQLGHHSESAEGASPPRVSCRIPDAYLEPAPETYRALRRVVERIATAALEFRATDAEALERWQTRTTRLLRAFERIARDELAGHALTDAQRRLLGWVVEVRPSTEGEPLETGWYVDLFGGQASTVDAADFVTDWHHPPGEGAVSYVGARGVSLGLFVVDRGGAPRVMFGPVARGFEHRAPASEELTDTAARELETPTAAPWTRAYTVAAAPPPTLAVEDFDERDEDPYGGDRVMSDMAPRRRTTPPPALSLRIDAGATPGLLTVELLTAHHQVIARGQTTVGRAAATMRVQWTVPPPRPVVVLQPGDEETDEDRLARETPRYELLEEQVCAVRTRLGDWVRVVSTDRYPESAECRMARGSDVESRGADGDDGPSLDFDENPAAAAFGY